jgi:hypothetical protein
MRYLINLKLRNTIVRSRRLPHLLPKKVLDRHLPIMTSPASLLRSLPGHDPDGKTDLLLVDTSGRSVSGDR